MTSPDPVTVLLSAQPAPCPRCGHRLTSAPEGRCSECGVALIVRLAISEPSAPVVPLLIVALTLSAAVGVQRLIVYATRLDQLLDGRLAQAPWFVLVLEVSLLAAPWALAAVLWTERRWKLMPIGVVRAATVVAAAPFLGNLLSLLR
jgi:hypothetical protein